MGQRRTRTRVGPPPHAARLWRVLNGTKLTIVASADFSLGETFSAVAATALCRIPETITAPTRLFRRHGRDCRRADPFNSHASVECPLVFFFRLNPCNQTLESNVSNTKNQNRIAVTHNRYQATASFLLQVDRPLLYSEGNLMNCTAPEGHAPNKLDCTSVFPTADAALVLGGENNLRTVISHTPFLLTRCSAELRYLFVSDAYARMLGLRPEQIIGRPIPEIIGEKAFKTILPHVRSVLQGKYVEYESEIHFKSVGARSIRAIYTPERDNQGSVKGWVASIIDMSHQKVPDPGVGPCRFSPTDGSRKDPAEDDGALQSPGCVETAVSIPRWRFLRQKS